MVANDTTTMNICQNLVIYMLLNIIQDIRTNDKNNKNKSKIPRLYILMSMSRMILLHQGDDAANKRRSVQDVVLDH